MLGMEVSWSAREVPQRARSSVEADMRKLGKFFVVTIERSG